jgi:hypothetical protein
MIYTLIRLGSYVCVLSLVVAAVCVDLPASAGSSSQNTNSTNRAPTPESATTNISAPQATEEVDLSGTYTGTFNCPDAGVSGETTLTITGKAFTLSDGKSGRITSAMTRGYIGVTMQFGELVMATPQQPSQPPVIVSMRARKSGDRLTLSTIPNERRVCSFTPKR